MSKVPSTWGWLTMPLRLLMGGLFVFAGYVKLSNPQLFAFSVAAFDVFPKDAGHAVKLVAFAVPWTEIIAGTLLILGLWTRAAALVFSLLLLAFIIGIVSVLKRNLNVECGCFGKFEVPCKGNLGTCHLVRNGVMLAVALLILVKGPGAFAIDREPRAN
ncbi:MAG: DoxX family protein [Planctomycetes bacterium]|nr:DoxX family protein [Planctomycetota bacterium]